MTSSLAPRIAAFELRRQLSSSPFWIVLAITALTVFGAVTVERIQIGPLRNGLRNGPTAVALTHLVWSLFFLFTAVALVADAVLADERTGFAPILRSTPTAKRDHLLGRFAGAFAACALCFAAVPLALWLGTLAPWLDPALVAPFSARPYAYAVVVLALPNLFVACAVAFALATGFRSPNAGYLGAVALLVLYDVAAGPSVRDQPGLLAALTEPFGFAAYARATAVASADLPSLAGALGANRLLWLAIGATLLGWAVRRYPWRGSASPPPRLLAQQAREVAGPRGLTEGAARVPFPVRGCPLHQALPGPPPPKGEEKRPTFGLATLASQLAARLRLELGLIFRSPTFGILMLIGLGNAAAVLWGSTAGGPLPDADVAARLSESFRLVPVAVTLVFAGEIVWGERDRRVHELVGATPIAGWALLLPKLAALLAVLVSLLLASAAAAAAVQALRGGGLSAIPILGRDYIAPGIADWAILAALAVFLQAVAPGKLAGWGLMILYLIAALTLENLGLNGSLYRYGGHPDLLAGGRPLWGWTEAGWVRTYWGCLALAMLAAAAVLYGRGLDAGLGPRVRRLGRSPAGLVAAAALAAFAGLGVALGGAGLR